jgi:hypothetical protein
MVSEPYQGISSPVEQWAMRWPSAATDHEVDRIGGRQRLTQSRRAGHAS